MSRELLSGGTCKVFLATELALGRQVVLKVLPAELTREVDGERFRREILIAARLQHPHLVPLLSAGEFADEHHRTLRWFSMPYVEGCTLRELLEQRGTLPLGEALRLLRELASALAYAHARGVVHRDIKPDNVLLCGDVAMISDFGVAKALDDAVTPSNSTGRQVTTVSLALGTPAYMAPEQVANAAVVDHKADLYALGCVAYEFFTGEPPLARPSLRATLAAQVHDAPIPLDQRRPDLPDALCAVLMRCLHKDPLQRPHSASVIVRVLDDLLSPASASVATEPSTEHEHTRQREPSSDDLMASATRHARGLGPRATAAALVGIVLLVSLVLWLQWQGA